MQLVRFNHFIHPPSSPFYTYLTPWTAVLLKKKWYLKKEPHAATIFCRTDKFDKNTNNNSKENKEEVLTIKRYISDKAEFSPNSVAFALQGHEGIKKDPGDVLGCVLYHMGKMLYVGEIVPTSAAYPMPPKKAAAAALPAAAQLAAAAAAGVKRKAGEERVAAAKAKKAAK